jgi:hypothetical protein
LHPEPHQKNDDEEKEVEEEEDTQSTHTIGKARRNDYR